MTVVEFFEKDAIENICSSLINSPDRVVLVGDRRSIRRSAERYQAVLSARGLHAEFLYRTVNKNRMQDVIDALSQIVQEFDDCVLDLTGGDDLYLVAAGVVLERFQEKRIQMHRFNIRNNTIIDADQDGQMILAEAAPKLTIRENIQIYGGDVIYEAQKSGATVCWDMNPAFREAIKAMWELCRRDVRLWNTQICVLEAAEAFRSGEDTLTVTAPAAWLRDRVERSGGSYLTNRRILKGLFQAGLLTQCLADEDTFSVTYRDEQVKRCLTNAGKVLEMRVFLAALEASEPDGSATYQDVMNGVSIDWDGEIHTDPGIFDTENEIDVMMMYGLVPIFVSCKNGHIEMEELYKLNTLATRFGGKYAKKVLVATALDDSDYSNYLRQRASDMEIRLVEGGGQKSNFKRLTEMNDTELTKTVRMLCSNS